MIAGLAVWYFVFLNNSIGYGMIGLWPARLLVITDVSGLVGLTLAALAGAWFYRES